jgi:hypothetical protein
LPDGAGCFGGGFPGPPLLRVPARQHPVPVRGSHPLRPPFPWRSGPKCRALMRALQPRPRLDGGGLGSAAFARHYLRHHYCFLFLRVLRCFSSPGSPPCGCRAFGTAGFPIRAPADLGPCAAPRGFSQLIAPFIASRSLGIPRAPLIACRRAIAGAAGSTSLPTCQ